MAELLLPDEGAPVRDARLRWVPLRLVSDSGPRAIVEAEVEGVTVRMLVHANAGFTMMLTHAAFGRIAGRDVAKLSDYGLGHDLRVSELGRGVDVVDQLRVDGHVLHDVRCEVFELPTRNWEGMLGVGWLAAAGPVVDLAERRLAVPSASERIELADGRAGPARRVLLRRDAVSGSFLVDVSLSTTGTTAPFVASTVGATVIDIEHAHRCHLELVALDEGEHGPGGAVVANHRTRHPVTINAGGVPVATITPEVHDVYAYLGVARPAPADCIAGYLGADLLLASRAVLDFG